MYQTQTAQCEMKCININHIKSQKAASMHRFGGHKTNIYHFKHSDFALHCIALCVATACICITVYVLSMLPLPSYKFSIKYKINSQNVFSVCSIMFKCKMFFVDGCRCRSRSSSSFTIVYWWYASHKYSLNAYRQSVFLALDQINAWIVVKRYDNKHNAQQHMHSNFESQHLYVPGRWRWCYCCCRCRCCASADCWNSYRFDVCLFLTINLRHDDFLFHSLPLWLFCWCFFFAFHHDGISSSIATKSIIKRLSTHNSYYKLIRYNSYSIYSLHFITIHFWYIP